MSQYYQEGTAVDQHIDTFLTYKHTTFPGNSGCPILLKRNNTYFMIGIHKANTGSHNFGLLLKTLNNRNIHKINLIFTA